MKRVSLLAATLVACASPAAAPDPVIHNPYAGVDWETTTFVHSMSHYHSGRPPEQRQEAYDMGLRHLAFTNYYPAAPLYPADPEWQRQFPDATFSPNSEHASFIDSDVHANALGSLFRSGYGHPVHALPDAVDPASIEGAPLVYTFDDVNTFDPAQPWLGIYRLDLTVAGERDPNAKVTVRGGERVEWGTFETVGDGGVEIHPVACSDSGCTTRSEQIYLRSLGSAIEVTVDYDAEVGQVRQFRLMQGSNRPWRQVFRGILDGDTTAQGETRGLLYPDGGGITINHPGQDSIDQYIEMLDFDPRVLGIEVWNDRRWFGVQDEPPHDRYYQHWDDLLATGRRAYGFFVKDHRRYGQGRNVLLVPALEGLPADQRERALLRAYRQGTFFGLMGASAVDGEGRVAFPYDRSDFRFSKIVVEDGPNGRPALRVAVTGNDEERPELVLRFISDRGIESVHRTAEAVLPLVDADGSHPVYVRVEAFALPRTHLQGQPLDADSMAHESVYEIARIHDRLGHVHPNRVDARGQEPIPVADMIFSQAVRLEPTQP